MSTGADIQHPKRLGEWAEMRFMARATENGLIVTKPFGDSARYDFVVEYDGCLQRIQVKATTSKQYNSYACNLRGGTGQTYAENEIDFVAAYVIPLDIWYILPAQKAINYKSNIILSPHLENSKHAQYREAWHLLKEERCSANSTAADLCFRRGCQQRLAQEVSAPAPPAQNELSS